nr:PREDICTED: leucine-rich repeat-containing protein 66 [Paralichthys olivaceus]
MAVVQGPFFVTVLLLVSPGLHCSSPPPACPELCTCQRAPLLNCSSSGLSSVPQHIQDSVTELDLSQNRLDTVTLHRPYRNLRNVWLENNTITRLSLCIDKNLGAKSVRVRKTRQLGPWSRRRCVSWAPTLQLLSVERNHLIQLPEGLEGSASLWVLQLSFNRISTIRPGELRHLQQLKELHLKHNLITHLHPQMFQDLTQLRVLDLSFNMLTSLHPSMYLSLRNIGSDVRLDGNRWQCDCSMRSLRRRMSYDSDRGLQTWSVECAFPSVLSGKDLLQLEEDDLNCFGTENSPELHQDVTVYSGSEILLSCSKQDSSWLTPSDQESVSQPQASLFISDVSEKDTGLYVCMTEDHEVVSVFNLQISRVEHARRKARSVPRASPQVIPQERNQRATQSDLALAVCLSVFITFLIAFVLGVLVRPFIDVLWTKITNKRSPSATNSVSSAEQRQYENEAYSEGEEPEEIVTHRERRVTFNTVNIREDINVEYYDTLASGNQESVEAAKTEEDEHTAGESGSDNGSTEISPENNQSDARDISGTTDKRRRHKVQFEHIPDSKELEERSLSSCSDSSLSDRELKKDRMNKRDLTTPKSLQQAEDSVQQGADSSTSEIVPQLSIERTNEIPGFSSEPFADWSPHLNDTKPKDSDLWQGNEEQFDFSDSVGSNSARSSGMFGSFNDSKLNVLPTSDNQSRDDASSCSSHLSEDEPTQYTVNPDQEEEEDTKNNHNKSELTNTHLKQDARFEQQISGVDTSRTPLGFNQGNYPHDTLRPAERAPSPHPDSSSTSFPNIWINKS